MKTIRLLAPALTLFAAACSSPSAPPAEGSPSGLSYYKDVKGLVDAKCAKCHVPGGIAPFELLSYASVKENAAAIKGAVQSRTMPPWLASPGCTDYKNDRSLTDEEIKLLSDWVDAGAAEGDIKDAPKDAEPPKGLSRVDRTLSMPVPYTAQLEPDDYRCFLIDWPEKDAKYVTGFVANPGNAKVVHHVIAYVIPPASVAQYEKLDAEDAAPGYTCFGGPGGTIDPNTTFIGSWAPGAAGGDLPPGLGLKVQPGSKIALQVHYNTTNGGPQPDQTSISVKLDEKVEKEASWQFFTNLDWVLGKGMEIPAMKRDVTYSYSVDPTGFVAGGKPIEVYDAGLHMHTRGHKASLGIQRQAGNDECMLDIPNWNFHWQLTYELGQPKILNPGDKLSISCTWDNNTPKDLRWGEGTGDEMCLGLLLIAKP